MREPIRPEEAAARKLDCLPEEVIDAFNDLIAMHYDGIQAMFSQEEIVNALVDRGVIQHPQEAFDRHLLDVEPVYRAYGWTVTYDKPAYNEPGRRAWFTFAREA